MDYKDLEVWKESRKLVKLVYEITADFPKSEKFGLTNQIRRSSVSIVSNIAEGQGRKTRKENLQFLYIAKGSLFELETQLLVSNDLGFIDVRKLTNFESQLAQVKKLLFGLIKYLDLA